MTVALPVLREGRTKRPAETCSYTFDFTLPLVTGSTLTGAATVTPATGLTVAGGPTVATPFVTVQLTGGVAGNDYPVTCRISATNGDLHELEAVILVRDEN